MTNLSGTSLSPTPVAAHILRKVNARAALFNLPERSSSLLTECFRQFGIETVAISANAAERIRKEKFEACVLPLVDGSEAIMESARNSPSNSRCILYGMGGNAQEAMRMRDLRRGSLRIRWFLQNSPNSLLTCH